ncbi:PDZ domain-containing protein [Phormidium sp. LEGE 05292]|uniref:carboxyl-terminal processing protease CtpA n=1 Tax=[Phormidium] sp. LEGE 05292 TaxID=767427 RepID=UPI00187F9D60|nr:carboxyl-terminal processing protease CtpA [Phormidium sp. LEGE 05292]MBE9230107.1 PDZ domain-containing protein [Phormidium sp. LEGE 05292]
MKNRYLRIVLSLILSVILGLGWWVPSAKADTENQKLIAEVWRIVNQSYVDETFNHQNWWLVRQNAMKQRIKSREEAYSVIVKMLASLDDPFTRHLQPSQYRNLQVSTSGELTGVGIQIALDEETGALQVITPIAGSPAEKAGIKPGDRILKINGVFSTQFTLDEAAAQMRGPMGSQVVLTVARAKEEAQEVTIVRDRIALNPVIAELRSSPGSVPVGYIRLNQFNGNAVTEVANAISNLEKQGADAYILDLRNNPGGLLQAGIEIARLWLDQGTIVYTVNRQGIIGSFEATNVALTKDPLVVLVNRGTASASEILAGALQDNQRAQIVGEKSFGKGLIQSLFDLSDGSGLAVTVAKYETPNHHDINKLGITPDRIVSWEPTAFNQIATEVDQQYKTAFELLTTSSVVANAS